MQLSLPPLQDTNTRFRPHRKIQTEHQVVRLLQPGGAFIRARVRPLVTRGCELGEGLSNNGSFHVLSVTRVPASPLSTRPNRFGNSSRPIMQSPVGGAVSGWGSLSQSTSLRCRVVRSGLSHSPAKARLLQCMSPLMAQSGDPAVAQQRPLSGVKRTSVGHFRNVRVLTLLGTLLVRPATMLGGSLGE